MKNRPTHCEACQSGPLRTVRLIDGATGRARFLCRRCLANWDRIRTGATMPAPPLHLGAPPPRPRVAHRPPGRPPGRRYQQRARRVPWTRLHEAVKLGQKREHTKRGYLVAVDSFVGSAGADPAGWTGYAVELWRQGLAARVSPQTRNGYLHGVKYAAKRYAALGWGPDFAAGIETLAAPHEAHRRPMTLDEARRLVEVCRDGTPAGLRDAAAFMLGFRTGLRREGICRLTFADVGPGRRLRVVLKGGRRHEIQAVDDETLATLGDWMGWLRGHGVEHGPIFRGLKNSFGRHLIVRSQPLATGSLNRVLGRRAAAARVGGFHPHRMRHSFISWQIAAGASDRDIMAVTGQTDPKTLSIYHTDVRPGPPLGDNIPSLR